MRVLSVYLIPFLLSTCVALSGPGETPAGGSAKEVPILLRVENLSSSIRDFRVLRSQGDFDALTAYVKETSSAKPGPARMTAGRVVLTDRQQALYQRGRAIQARWQVERDALLRLIHDQMTPDEVKRDLIEKVRALDAQLARDLDAVFAPPPAQTAPAK